MKPRGLGMAVALTLCGCPALDDGILPVPAEGEGFQFAIEPFEVPAGHDVQSCYFVKVPGAEGADVWVNQIVSSQTDGSHHMNIFRVKTIRNLIGEPGGAPVVSMDGKGECFISSNWADWPLVTNTQIDGKLDWKLPDGVGHRFKGGELLMLQTHYVNASTQQTPGYGRVAVNFLIPKETPASELGTLFATNQNIRVCPGDVDRFFTKTCRFPSAGVNVVAANGHFHSRGKLFEMYAVDAQGNLGERFYTSQSWDDPPMTRDFNTQLVQGGGVQWKCTFDFPQGACGGEKDMNGNPTCCYKFGGTVDNEEHCNAFVYYWPKTVDVNCF